MKTDKKQKPLKNYAFRADEAQMNEARELGIDVGGLLRQALGQQIIHARGKCPWCGAKQKDKPHAA